MRPDIRPPANIAGLSGIKMQGMPDYPAGYPATGKKNQIRPNSECQIFTHLFMQLGIRAHEDAVQTALGSLHHLQGKLGMSRYLKYKQEKI